MSLKAWLKQLNLSHISGTLEEFGLTTTNDLATQREDDLREIIKELDLKPRQKIKFKVAVRKLEIEDRPRFVITSAEESAMKNLSSLTKAAKSSLTSIEKTMQAVRKNGKHARTSISYEFRDYHNQLKQREERLLNDATTKEKDKLTQLEEQCNVLTAAIAQFTQAKIDTDKLFNVSGVDGVENRTKSVATKITNIAKLQFPTKPATTPHIRYESDQQALKQRIDDHGTIVLYGDIKPPKITHLKEESNSIQVSWEVAVQPGAPQKALPVGFTIRVSEVASTSAGAGREGHADLETEFECDGKADSYLIKDLKMDTNYKVWVKVKNAFGWSSYGTPSIVKTKTRTLIQVYDSSLLDHQGVAKLNEFLGGECKNTRLLYKASRDGFGETDFHKRCDQKGPTVTVIKRNGSDTVYGGYTPCNWGSNGYSTDAELRSFLFTMSDDNGKPAKYNFKKGRQNEAIHGGASYGPVFGGGHDLHICTNSNTSNGSYVYPHSYEFPSKTSLCGLHINYTISEIEVFSVSK